MMVVDDSVTARAVFSRVIAPEPDMDIVALASTAEEALATLPSIPVDVILLDLEMPGRGGLDALPDMLACARGAQVLVVSTLTKAGAEATLRALSLGAADTLEKPHPGCFDSAYREELVKRVRTLGAKSGKTVPPSSLPIRTAGGLARKKRPKILAIGASTGGIHALRAFFDELPRCIGIPILITQHLPSSFMAPFAEQIASFSHRPAAVAQDGAVLQPDEVLVAPGHAHITVVERRSRFEVRLDERSAASGCRPSVDPMLASLAAVTDGHALAVILSGMGRDGAIGASDLHAAGGTLMVQDEASSAVWGMPGAIARAGLASQVLPPEQLARQVPVSVDAA